MASLPMLRHLNQWWATARPTINKFSYMMNQQDITGTGRGISSLCGKLSSLSMNENHSVLVPQNTAFDQRRSYAMRLELTEHGIVWRRPQYIPSWKPAKSGDLAAINMPDVTRPPLKLLAAKEAYEQVDEDTRRFLSLEMANRNESLKIARRNQLKKVQRHKYDEGSLESSISMLTVKIRNLQEHLTRDKKNTLIKVRLIEIIARRKKMLKHLRRMDYKRFEWLIEELNIQYKPFPTAYHWITRKNSLRKLVQMHKTAIKEERLEEYKQQLKEQEKTFLKEKAEILEWIEKAETEVKALSPKKVRGISKS